MEKPRNFDDVLSKIPGAKQSGEDWAAPCPLPGHKTPSGHLTLKDAGNKALVSCWGGRHSYQDICRWLDFSSLVYSKKSNGKHRVNGKARYSVKPPDNCKKKTVTPYPSQGVTVEVLAAAKRLPTDFLKSLGVSDFRYCGQHTVRIPYYDETGTEAGIRFRLSLMAGDGERFKWRKGDHAMPYGLQKIKDIRKSGWVLIVEGESDCWTCWHYGIPALGAPGKSIWPITWAEYLTGLEVYVWQEPGAQDFPLRILATAPELKYIPAPDGIKDISEAHIQGLDVPEWLERLKSEAQSAKALKEQTVDAQIEVAYEAARHVIQADDPLVLVADAIKALGYGGDLKPAMISYLAVTSRLLDMRVGAMPVHILLIGPSSAGKNYTISRVLKLLPDEAYHIIDAGSPRVLIYDDAELQHRALIFTEADSLPAGEDNPAASATRNLLQDHHLHYAVTVRDLVTGNYTVREIDKPGPTVLITTSTKPLGTQLMTRLFALEISDDKTQIGARLRTQAALETDIVAPPDRGLVEFQRYLQLKAPIKVVVPFAKPLGEAMTEMAMAPRILRDFARLMSLIKATALVRYHHRQCDSQGQVIATLADYQTVRALVNDMYIDNSTGATPEVRKLVEAVSKLHKARSQGEKITVTKLALHLHISNMAASRRSRRALKEDWLINRESRKGYPADLALGEPMPKVEGLPTAEDIETYSFIDSTSSVTDFSFANGDHNAITPSPDNNTAPEEKRDAVLTEEQWRML